MRSEPIVIDQFDWQHALDGCQDKASNKFAWTFYAKANAMYLWPHARGIFNMRREVIAGIIVRVNKIQPVANLQLLHTFSQYRRQGLAKFLVESEFDRCRGTVKYFRVSAEEEAVPFYRALGFKFWGRQKSGCLLSVFRIAGSTIAEGEYDLQDAFIDRLLNTKARGGLVEHFEEGAC